MNNLKVEDKNNTIDLQYYGYKSLVPQEDSSLNIPGRVTAVHRDRYEVICTYGEVAARLKGGVYYKEDSQEAYPTVGDFVMLAYNSSGDSIITETMERSSCFTRRSPDKGKGLQAVAANFDYVFILTSLNQDLNPKRIERYITEAWQSGGIPVVILTKADLKEDFSEDIREVEKVAIGVGVFPISSKSGYGLEALSDYLKPRKTIVFMGSSGVGKSSLVNALAGENIMNVSSIREDDSKGRHTTTHRQLIMLKNGVMIIDTPGMRELGMWDVSIGLKDSFSEVESLFTKCKFSNCSHSSEPGCGVLMAIENGDLSRDRWESYLKLKKEAKYTEDKEGYLRERTQFFKGISKQLRNNKKKR